MTAAGPDNDSSPDDIAPAALDEDAAPEGGAEPDTAGAGGASGPDVEGVPVGPDATARTVLDGPALENEEMRRGTEDLRSSVAKTAQAREFADEVARKTEPEPPARPGDES